jgi:predicted ATPase/DNA-binding winged helix-turn-helix (wHTH) protein
MRDKPIVDIAFVFGPFRLVPSQQILLNGDRPVKLGGRALDILHLLVRRAGEEISKDDLIAFAWPKVHVDEHNLKVHISSLRRALGDTLQQATYLATVVGHGYQFVAQVHTERIGIADLPDGEDVEWSLPDASALIGRQRDVEGVARALDFARLVTLVGPGGVGKTSLAIAVAHARREAFPDGIHFADLAATNDPALVPHILAKCLGIRGHGTDVTSIVADYLQDRRVLLIMDNCEHLLHGVATVALRLIEANTDSRFLVTSRAPLGVIGENTQRVEPLAFPRRTDVRSASEVLAYSAVALFVLRALETAEYQVADGEAPVIAQLCEALDGLPLAIEIVAAKLDQFTLAELLESVSCRLREIQNQDNAAHSRHLTLWATLDWSYQLLSRDEATIFRLLSVFAGSFEWTDVAGVARVAEYDPHQTTIALGGLVSKSLLSAEISGEELRYRFLETTRHYAAERLLQDRMAQSAQRQHAHIILARFAKSEAEWASVDDRIWRARYDAWIADLRKALDWCFSGGGDASLGVHLALSGIRLWNEQSSIFEQLFQVERALKHCVSLTDAPRRMAMLASSRAWCMAFGGQLHAATDDAWISALHFAELSNDPVQRLSVMCGMALFLVATGRNEQAISLLDDVIRIATQAGDRASLFDGERLRAMAEVRRGNLLVGQPKLAQLAEDLSRGMPQSKLVRYQVQSYVSIHGMLALSTWLTGQPKRALGMAEAMVLETSQNGHLMGQSRALALCALPLALWSGHLDEFERYSRILGNNLDRGHIALWSGLHRFYAAVTLHARGDLSAVDEMRVAVDDLVRDRFLERAPMYLGVVAEALFERGRSAEAEETVESALTLQRATKENWNRPELLRVKAQITGVLGQRNRSEATLKRAREDAIAIGARTLELRIVNDMAQQAISGGDNETAVRLLVPLYEAFQERDCIADLKNSARLLSEAGASWNSVPK